MEKETLIVNRFAKQMIIELENNQRKGSLLEWTSFENMITELEYHKAKMFIAIRSNDMNALKEYLADQANILMAIGNKFNLYDNEIVNENICHELSLPCIIEKNNSEAKTVKEIVPGG